MLPENALFQVALQEFSSAFFSNHEYSAALGPAHPVLFRAQSLHRINADSPPRR